MAGRHIPFCPAHNCANRTGTKELDGARKTMAGISGRLISVAIMGAVLTACGGGGGPSASRDVPLENLDAETIYKRAELELETDDPEEAAEYFGEVERLYP